MRAMFKVTLKESKNPSGIAFTHETLLASDAADAIRKTEKEVKRSYKGVRLFVSDVEMLAIETIST